MPWKTRVEQYPFGNIEKVDLSENYISSISSALHFTEKYITLSHNLHEFIAASVYENNKN